MDRWSDRVVVALGQNPGLFTGPGTNTYLIGTGPRRILLDTGSGQPEYLGVLESALALAGCEALSEIVLTHAHPDHIGGVQSIAERYGAVRVSKFACPHLDDPYELELTCIDEGALVRTEGATLRAVHTPGHAKDHLCFILEEEGSLFSGDHVLGVGTPLIPIDGGDLLEYMRSLQRLLEENPTILYPAHGPRIPDATAKIRETIAHRREREEQIVVALADGPLVIARIVARVYKGYPESLYALAGETVCAHLLALEREKIAGRPERGDPLDADPLTALWELL